MPHNEIVHISFKWEVNFYHKTAEPRLIENQPPSVKFDHVVGDSESEPGARRRFIEPDAAL